MLQPQVEVWQCLVCLGASEANFPIKIALIQLGRCHFARSLVEANIKPFILKSWKAEYEKSWIRGSNDLNSHFLKMENIQTLHSSPLDPWKTGKSCCSCSYDTLLIKYLLLLLQTPMKCLLPSFEAIVKCLLLFWKASYPWCCLRRAGAPTCPTNCRPLSAPGFSPSQQAHTWKHRSALQRFSWLWGAGWVDTLESRQMLLLLELNTTMLR